MRALRVLNQVSVIYAEDTRHTRKLLSHYGISTPLQSYHQHNKRTRLDVILAALRDQDVALVSSAGMPAVADPGFELIQAVVEAGLQLDVLPGPNAAVTAVVCAALPAPGFLFVGFLPRKSGDRRRRLEDVLGAPYSLVFYEAPHRLRATLSDIQAILGDRSIVVARELTKVHQEIIRGTVSQVLNRFVAVDPRGECTLVVSGAALVVEHNSEDVVLALRQHRHLGSNARAAVTEVAQKFGLSRNEVYRRWLDTADE